MRPDYEKVVHLMGSPSEVPDGTIDDFIADAGIHPESTRGKELHRMIAADLCPQKRLRDFAEGGRVNADARARKPERWAKGLAMTPRMPRTEPKSFIHPFLSGLLSNSARMPADSPRRLPEEVSDAMTRCVDLSLSEADAHRLQDLLRTILSHSRELRLVLDVHEEHRETMKTNDALVQRLLRYDSEMPTTTH